MLEGNNASMGGTSKRKKVENEGYALAEPDLENGNEHAIEKHSTNQDKLKGKGSLFTDLNDNEDNDFLDLILSSISPGKLLPSTQGGGSNSSALNVAGLVLIWYISAAFAITTSKMIMLNLPLPYVLSNFQFLVASVVLYFIINSKEGKKKRSGSDQDEISRDKLDETSADKSWVITVLGKLGLPYLNYKYTGLLYKTAISYAAGFVFTNMAFSVTTASMAETIKSTEPISSVVLGYFILNEVESIGTYASLVPVCVGVAVSCINDQSFNSFGFSCAAASNICLSLRAVWGKKIMKQYPRKFDEIKMFGAISFIGLCIITPVALIKDGPKLYDKFIIGFDSSFIAGRFELVILFICNGLAYTCYNLMSFFVLTRINLATHAVLNCFRRVWIIIFTCYYFQIPISNTNLAGVGIAVTGVIGFAYTRSINKQSVTNTD